MECIDEIGGQRLKEFGRNFELSLGKADGALGFSPGSKWTNLCNRYIPFAQKNSFSSSKLSQVTRKMRSGLVNIEPNHGVGVA